MAKNISVFQGDTYDLGYRVSKASGPVDLSVAGTEIVAFILDPSGTRVIVPFEVQIGNAGQGQFRIHLSSTVTRQLRGKYVWFTRYISSTQAITLTSGTLTIKVIT